MKKILAGALVLGSLFTSCSKDDGGGDDGTTEVYLNTATGSSWTYQNYDNTTPTAPATEYTQVSTNRDTTVAGKTYHIYTNTSTGASVYNGRNGNDYSAFESLPAELGGTAVDNIYLKAGASVNTSWTQTYNVNYMGLPISVSVTNQIMEKGINKTVNGTTYNNVIHVKTDLAIGGIPPGVVTFTTDIHQYYAPNYGMIESNARIDVTFTGSATQTTDVSTRLKTATLL